MRWSLQTWSWWFVVLLVLTAVGNVMGLNRALVQLEDRAQWVEHTRQVLQAAESLSVHMVDAESGQRGYLLTGNPAYLAPYRSAQQLADEDWRTLVSMTEDNVAQQSRLAAIRDAMVVKFSLMHDTLAMYDAQQREAAIARVNTDAGRRMMVGLRDGLAAVRAEEQRLLQDRRADYEQARLYTRFWFMGSAGLVVGIGLLAWVMLGRKVVRPVQSLSQRVRAFGEGAAFAPSGPEARHGAHEMVRLAEAFEGMATALVSRQQELAAAAERADAANQAKSRFLANMSHEIRTPLNAMLGLAYLLDQPDLPATQREQVRKIRAAGQGLLGLINDVLDLAKIEAGELNVEHAPFSLRKVIDEVAAILGSQAQSKGLAFEVAGVPPEVPDVLEGDALRLRQILINLVGNAVKFTSRGAVKLGLRRVEVPRGEAGDSERVRVRFTVRDTGVGMSAEVMSRLFQPFMQADVSTTRRFGGTGLGLSIVRQLSEHLGGEVGVESEPGVGSTFWVELPFDVSVGQRIDPLLGRVSRGFEVIVADDDASCREHLVLMARGFGWQVEDVADGQQLVSRVLQRAHSDRPVDALVVDWQMPTLDGLEALHQLADALGPKGVPGTIVVTAHGLEQVMRSPLAGLPDSLLLKPVDSSKLFNEVNAAVIKHGGQPHLVLDSSRLGQPQVRWLDGVTVLLVDDSEINLEVAQEILRSEGALVSTCQSGQAALDWLRTPGQKVDVVLMDVQMPEMDGNTAVRHIREDARLSRLPVIALTAGALLSERERSYEAGMDDYLTKPFEPEQMVRVVRRHVERVRGAPLLVGMRPEPVSLGEASEPAAGWPQVPGIDTQEVRARLNGDVALFQRSLTRLMDEFGDLRAPLSVPVDAPTRQALQSRMHKLAGNTGLIGAKAVQRFSQEAERCLRERDDVGLMRALGELAAAFHELAMAIEPYLSRQGAATVI